MPVKNGMGYSGATPDKQSGLAKYMSLHMKIVRQILDKYRWADQRYYYFDLNAGCGENIEIGIDGSPRIFKDQVSNHGLDYEAYLIEIEKGNCQDLDAEFSKDKKIKTINANNAEVILQILENFTGKEYGLIYIDPNNLADFDLIEKISFACGRLDILVRYPVTSLKRARGAHCEMFQRIIEYINRINKEKKIIRAPMDGDKFQWVFLFFANYINGGWGRERFFDISSNAGKEILKKLNYTREELDHIEQPELFVKEKVKERSGGTCEVCKKRPATEIHHFKGSYGVHDPEKRVHVCHECHCELEGKES